jgi:hypothetical protein
MMPLTPKDISEFRALFRAETGRDISDEEARSYALSLLQLVAFVTDRNPPIPATDRPRDLGEHAPQPDAMQ